MIRVPYLHPANDNERITVSTNWVADLAAPVLCWAVSVAIWAYWFKTLVLAGADFLTWIGDKV